METSRYNSVTFIKHPLIYSLKSEFTRYIGLVHCVFLGVLYILKMAEPQPAASFRHIVRIVNVDLPGDKPIHWALTNIKGIGINLADAVCSLAQVQKEIKAGNLNEEQVKRLHEIIGNPVKNGIPTWMINRRRDSETGEDKHLITSILTYVQDNDIKMMKKMRSYKGVRHIHSQPVRGQRTRSNFRRNKGKVVGVVKKKVTPGAAGEKEDSKKGGKK